MQISYKKAFTMIELIFVIVIIGILAAVAIPKLTATRDDAKISAIISNAKITLGDFQKYYTSQGSVVWSDANLTVGTVTDVPLGTDCSAPTPEHQPISGGTPLVLCDETDGQPCITMTPSTDEVNIKSDGGTIICNGVLESSAIQGIIGGTISGSSKSHPLGGLGTSR